MSSSYMRLGSANTYDATLGNLLKRQTELSSLQEHVAAGKRVIRASDDPTAAVQAERANTRLERVATEQRALLAQRNTVAVTESTLGDATKLLQSFRDLVVQSGNASLGPSERVTIAKQLQGLRDQLLTLANTRDSNGMPVFGGLGSAASPFVDTSAGVVYQGNTGVQSASPVAIPFTADGQAAWMNVPTGNGVFTVSLGAGNTGKAFTDTGVVADPSAAAAGGYDYTINFAVAGTGASAVTTYTVTNNTTATTSAAAPYTAGQSITFGGLSMVVRGAPANGDTLDVNASTSSGPGTGVFGVLDNAIAGMYSAGSTTTGVSSTNPALQQSIARALAEIDVSMERISTAQGRAGDLLNRADTITAQQEARDTQLQTDRSNAEDIDAVKALSDVSTLQLGYDVALKSYAAIQKLSLFNYIS